MRRWRWVAAVAASAVALVLVLGGLLEFLAPDVAYQVRDRVSEWRSLRRGRQFRIALGAATGSNYRIGTALNERLGSEFGYRLDLVQSALPGNVGALLAPVDYVDLAIINSADDEAVRTPGVLGLAALEPQYFFVVVPDSKPGHGVPRTHRPRESGPAGTGPASDAR